MEEKVLFEASLGFLIEGNRVLLSIKKKKIGAGCWNGYGGGIQFGETPEASLFREFREETSQNKSGVAISLNHTKRVAELHVKNTTSEGKKFICKVYVFLITKWEGELEETEEMGKPEWFDIDKLPFEEMMPVDRIWLPLVLSGQRIKVEAEYGPFQKTLIGEVKISKLNNETADDEENRR
jgi:ADP-ribose pyrophosphatase YjhB (NUDIX family)